MTQHSSMELDSAEPPTAAMPLSERPLVADDDNTVVASSLDDPVDTGLELDLTATAREIRERLFGGSEAGETPEYGLRIGQFEIISRIGTGGMGAVFHAIDRTLARPVALKVLYPGTSNDASLVARFRQEARAAAQLNHDNIARVFFSDEQDSIHYIAYEFADGPNIKQLITDKGTLSVEETINYAIQATLALNHIQASGIVHRDIKPSNIIVTKSGRVKVVDLGLARRETQDSIGDLTVAGTTLGTFDYISPEQARDPSSADIRSDIYSLGCTIYHMLTGQPPYPEGTALQKLLDHQGKTPPDPRTVARDVPVRVASITQKMMNTDPAQRYQEPGQLLADLIGVATDLGLRTVPAEGVVWRRVPIRQIRQFSGSIFLLMSVIAICGTALAMHFLPGSDAESTSGIPDALVPAELKKVTGRDSDVNSVAGPPESSSSEEGIPDKPSVVPPPETEVADVFGLLRSADNSTRRFTTFREAWGQAGTGDVIILDYDGVQAGAITELPQTDAGIVDIRAADGRSPTLLFRVDRSASDFSQQLFHLKNNLGLTLTGVNIRVELGTEVHDEFTALFQCSGYNRVSLKDCGIEIDNPERHNMAVIQVTDASVTSNTASSTALTLDGVVVRGCCDVVLNSSLTPVRVEAKESAFLLDGSIIYHRGSDDMTKTPGQMGVLLEHTSCILARAAIRMEDSDGLAADVPERMLPELSVTARSNVFLSLSPDGTFVQSHGNANIEELEELFRWNGSFNLYHNFAAYWELKSGQTAQFDVERPPRGFEEWVEHWSLITATAEEDAVEFQQDILLNPGELDERSRNEIPAINVSALELQRQPFFSSDRYPQLTTDDSGRIPGVMARSLPTLD